MHQYVIDVEHAVTVLTEAIFYEEMRISELNQELKDLSRYLAELGRAHEFLTLNPDLDDEGLGTFTYWEGQFGSGNVDSLEERIKAVTQRIEDHHLSVAALSGALLQIGKQGISSIHGYLTNCPNDGRPIGSQPLKGVIWEARNQSMHYEERKYKEPVIKCFATLERDFGERFSLRKHPRTNLAYHVVKLLEWVSFERFAEDLDPLLSH